MNISFDYFGQPEIPYIILTNPDKSELYSLGLAYNTEINLKFNTLSEFSFEFPQSIDGGQTIIDAYDYIQNKRLIEIEGYGYYLIVDIEEDETGAVPTKKISCNSLESDLISKRVTAYGGTVKLYDIISPSGTLLDDMIKLAPTWSIGTIDVDLLTIYRTFNISDSNVYNFLMNDVSKAFECVFFFNTDTKIISAKSINNSTTNTDIFLSFDNIIKDSKFSEKSDEISTCLSVYGGGTLDIEAVNPLGTNKIYDFSYYTNTNWMSQGLVTALNNWTSLVSSKQTDYANLLSLLLTYNASLLSLEVTLTQLNSDYLSLQGIQKTRIQQGLPYSDINAQLVAKQAQIDSQNILITNKESQINTTQVSLQTIHNQVSFTTNFTSPQLLELNNFIYENTYKNENIIQTDSMTNVDIQNAEQALYNQAISVLGRVSQPRYEIEMNSANYIALEEFSVFTTQTELGSVVTAEIKSDVFVETILLNINFKFDNPTDFSMLFSNRVRLDESGFIYSDLFGSVVKTGSSVSFDNLKWANWSNDYKDDVTTFITSSLNTATNNIINNNNQEILINQNGLRGRTYNTSSHAYDPTQVWLTSSVLAFTDDGFQTSKLAIGKLTIAGHDYFGLVGQYIIGNIIAGNTLTISNSANNFVLDQTGATLNNAKFTLTSTNSKIFIDPTSTKVFDIQKNEGGTFVDKFWVDNTGNVNFSGILSGASGTFTGSVTATIGNIGTLVIDADGLKTSDGINYLRGNGDFKWGGLSITGGSATFNGTIFANKISGSISYGQLTDIPADKITSGTMSGNRISGGTGTFSGINSTGSSLTVGNSLQVNGQIVNTINNNSIWTNAGIVLAGNLSANNINGLVSSTNGFTGTRSVTTPVGTRILTVVNGIVTNFA